MHTRKKNSENHVYIYIKESRFFSVIQVRVLKISDDEITYVNTFQMPYNIKEARICNNLQINKYSSVINTD